MAEIEYFVDPECKSHPKFDAVADLKVRLYSKDKQMAGEAAVDVTLKEAVNQVNALFVQPDQLQLVASSEVRKRLQSLSSEVPLSGAA